MYIKFQGSESGVPAPPAQINCPFCGGFGTFNIVSQSLRTNPQLEISIQCCPSESCRGLVIIVFKNRILQKTYPGIGRPINTENVPERIKSAFREGVECFANNCFVAAAIMIRKTLEEICIDKGASGSNLYKKIQDLSTSQLRVSSMKMSEVN